MSTYLFGTLKFRFYLNTARFWVYDPTRTQTVTPSFAAHTNQIERIQSRTVGLDHLRDLIKKFDVKKRYKYTPYLFLGLMNGTIESGKKYEITL